MPHCPETKRNTFRSFREDALRSEDGTRGPELCGTPPSGLGAGGQPWPGARWSGLGRAAGQGSSAGDPETGVPSPPAGWRMLGTLPPLSFIMCLGIFCCPLTLIQTRGPTACSGPLPSADTVLALAEATGWDRLLLARHWPWARCPHSQPSTSTVSSSLRAAFPSRLPPGSKLGGRVSCLPAHT